VGPHEVFDIFVSGEAGNSSKVVCASSGEAGEDTASLFCYQRLEPGRAAALARKGAVEKVEGLNEGDRSYCIADGAHGASPGLR
jgi:hypothetical protein